MILLTDRLAHPRHCCSARTARTSKTLLLLGQTLSLIFAASLSGSMAMAGTQAGGLFIAECQRDNVNPSLTYHAVVSRPGAFAGRELLIKGEVKAVLRTVQTTTYLVRLADGTEPGISAEAGVVFSPGDRVCALVRVPDHWNGANNLDIVDVVAGAEGEAAIRAMQAQIQVSAEPTYPRSGTREHYVTRPTYSRSYGSEMLPARRLLLEQYASAVHWFNPNLPPDQARSIAGHIIWYSQVYGVDARLIIAVIAVESSFDVNATSHSGAMGLGQLMPGTARDLGVVDAYDPQQNIAGAIRLLRWHLQQNINSQDPIAMALASYNAGENAVKRYHGVPPFHETQRYVYKIKLLYSQLCQGQ